MASEEPPPIPIDPDFAEGEGDSALGDDETSGTTTSLTDSIKDYRTIHGRTYQNSKTTEYWAPNDDQQNEGLDITNHYLTLLLDDKLFLAPISHDLQNVLDVGTGTGIWAIDFADQFPSAQVTGTDISPIQPAWIPPNCKFEIDDAQLQWTWPADHFDYVHIRNLHGSISNWRELYKQCFKHTKPNGWIENLEFNIVTKSDDDSVGPDHVYTQWSNLFVEAGERMGKTFKIASEGRMKQYITEAGYVDVVEKKWKCPIGGWSSDPKLKRIGLYTQLFLEQSLEGFALYMLMEVMGWEYIEIQALVGTMRTALRNKKLHPYYEIVCVYGRKPESPEAEEQ